MDTKGHSGKQRGHPGPEQKAERAKLRERLTSWFNRWGADSLLAVGSLLVSVGAGCIYPPAGLITGGVLLIVGGVLWARGKGGDRP